MKRIQLAIFLVFIVNLSACLEYDEDDDFPILEDFADEDDDVKPQIYNLKDAPKLFEKFVAEYKKVYKSDAERKERYQNFYKNLKEINKINKSGTSSADINLFADLAEKEFSVLGR
ncbi:cysteine proteinase-like [Aricia agestis]|uniref:cysteine proteinase-like n=1 Tax=Aricia agestis TaxID=91739 RepID=UPI001C20BEC3|nr:cysteine proteinase-like [Aricia agestis]XP_041978222.1 cysteine proteinase-like [Aricia agestis]